jgi:hypothetical protein
MRRLTAAAVVCVVGGTNGFPTAEATGRTGRLRGAKLEQRERHHHPSNAFLFLGKQEPPVIGSVEYEADPPLPNDENLAVDVVNRAESANSAASEVLRTESHSAKSSKKLKKVQQNDPLRSTKVTKSYKKFNP